MSLDGTLLIGQFGGPTPVVNASLAGLIRAAQMQGCPRILGLAHGLEGALTSRLVDLTSLSAGQLERLSRTPGAALGSGRRRWADNYHGRLEALLDQADVRYFVGIGGNGTMQLCQRLAERLASTRPALQVVGLPKTIDNDLYGTDHAPGYGSAARFLALAARDTGLDLEAMQGFDAVTVLEVMGRNTGWLAAATALARAGAPEAPHLIYVPERPFDEGQFLDDVLAVYRRLGRAYVVVSEGLRDANGEPVGDSSPAPQDPLGRPVPSLTYGVGNYLSDRVATRLALQSRCLRPGLIGRSASACVSRVDRVEAGDAGRAAVEALVAGRSRVMVALQRHSDRPYRITTGLVDLASVAGRERGLPDAYIGPAGNDVTPGFLDYARPLIGTRLPAALRLRRPPGEDEWIHADWTGPAYGQDLT